jgi:xanthine dehydrogenase YagS FAD-binding subunit
MQSFEHDEVTRFADVPRKVGRRDMLIAGGTDLVPLMRDGLVAPRTLVNLKTVRGGAEIRASASGGTLGALALVADIAAHSAVRRWYPALAAACDAVGTLQIRNMATIGGNLCQRIRCWYFRQNVPCHKTGGRGCPAVDGLNEYLSVFGAGPCHAPHPSDPAIALAALDAGVHVRLANAGRKPGLARLSIAELYANAAKRRDAETILKPGDVIERITVPGKFAGERQLYLKATQRAEWDFALVSVAVVWPKGRGAIPRLVLGGVAPQPRVVEIGETGKGNAWAEKVATAAVAGARPMSQNAYKVELARNLIREALTAS